MPTLQLGEPTDEEMPDFSAHATLRQPHRMSGESLFRREAEPAPGGRSRSRLGRPHFRVIGPTDAASADLFRRGARAIPKRPVREALKRLFDLMGAVALGLVFLPFILAICVMLRAEGGPIIFRHRRVGRDGKYFNCLKFRSMVPDADRVLRELLERQPELKAEWLRAHKLRNDPRITALGRFLRRTSLDELPQLGNVIRGEMSLVGPRPVVSDELLRYGRCACIYLAARPGVTGLWQVTGRNNTDYRRRVVLDVYYVRRQNLLLDLYILAKTTHVVLGGSGAY